MALSIRTKLTLAFTVMVVPLIVIVGLEYYNQRIIYNTLKKVSVISEEMQRVSRLGLTVEMALMPANDYIITGDPSYKKEFERLSSDVDGYLGEVEELLRRVEAHDFSPEIEKEKEVLDFAKEAWGNIKDISDRIFAVSDPVGDKGVAALMKEMDYRWAVPLIRKLRAWHDYNMGEYASAKAAAERARRESLYIFTSGAVFFALLGALFGSFFSRRFTRPIMDLRAGVEEIARGNLDHRVEIRTGDEIEELAEGFNGMGEKLKEFYALLEKKVRERTEELEAKIDELERFRKATVQRELLMKELKEAIKNLSAKIEKVNRTKGEKD